MTTKHYFFGALILIAMCMIASLFFLFGSTVSDEKGVVYYLKPGTSKKVFIAELSQQGIIRHPWLFSIYVYSHKGEPLKTGEYVFPNGASLVSIWHQVSTGTGLLYHPFTIVPGWSFHQLREELAGIQELHHTATPLNDKQIMDHLGYANLAPEGEFFPETYYYTKGISDFVILKHAFHLMQTKLQQAWDKRAPNLPFKNPYEALIAASLVEKEAYLNSERPMIAGVLVNRLRKNMLLQFDPTVIYGMGDRYAGKIHKENLQENNAYNTYVNKGLPPTPIAMPSTASIEAVMHPEVNDYYYFVARGDGSHQFSKSLPEHNAAVAATLKKQTSFFNGVRVQPYLYKVISETASQYAQNNSLAHQQKNSA